MLPENEIQIENLTFSYSLQSGTDKKNTADLSVCDNPVLKNVHIQIHRGELIAVLGANGSGKSTLAKHLNALLLPNKGRVLIFGLDTSDKKNSLEIRKNVGMVFQNPDNQIVGSVVEEDVGFGLENLCVPTKEIWAKVDDALSMVKMQAYRGQSPNRLSGGQKQRIAIAGVLAMNHACVVLDEATSMLDPKGRASVIQMALELKKQGVTVIMITHDMEEVIHCDRVFLMSEGKLCKIGSPREIFALSYELEKFKLTVPYITKMTLQLKKYLPDIAVDSLSPKELVADIMKLAKTKKCKLEHLEELETKKEESVSYTEELLRLEDVCYSYSSGTSFPVDALKHISLSIYKQEFLGIIGHTGSGKSTLIQHFNGLNKPDCGKILYKNQDIFDKKYSLKKHKAEVGLVFQYAEQQLFEATVLDDVCFGPLNQGYSVSEAKEMAKKALSLVDLDESFYDRVPFLLSGGQKRRVAIAGVLAMQPKILVLDEPTAGLDPIGKLKILDLICSLRDKEKMSIVMVSHSMEDIAEYADRVVVINQGEIAMDGAVPEVLGRIDELKAMDLNTSLAYEILYKLHKNGLAVDRTGVSIKEAVENIVRAVAKKSVVGME